MAKRITSMLLVVLLLAGMIPSALAAELPGGESAAETGQEESSPEEETHPEISKEDAPTENDSAALSSDDTISLYTAVSVSTDSTRQIRWISHNDGQYDTSYYDAQGVHHTGYITAISIHRIDDKIAYCIQPTVEFGTSYTENAADSAWMSQLTASQRTAIAMAIAYGYPNMDYPAADPPGAAGDSSLEYPLRTDLWQISERVAATQLIVWEIVMGKRTPTPPNNTTQTTHNQTNNPTTAQIPASSIPSTARITPMATGRTGKP